MWLWGCILILLYGSNNALNIIAGPDVINCTFSEESSTIYMMENNRNFSDNQKLLFYIEDPAHDINPAFIQDSFQYKMIKNNQSQTEFYALESFDYESNQRKFQVKIYDPYIVTINVLGYDDESPTLTAPMCSMKENTGYSSENTTCTSTLTDADGLLDQTTFTIINSNPSASTDLEMENKTFEFVIDKNIDDKITSAKVSIITKQWLDYEVKIFYSFSVQAQDSAGHSTTPNENITCIIDVEDQNDQPPQFTDYFTTLEILEKKSYEDLSVKAVDGDKGINAKIFYYIVPIDPSKVEDPYISIDKATGKLLIQPIDRDTNDLQSYQFTIRAEEQDDPKQTTNLTVTLYLEDIDDNSPLIMSVTDSNGTTIDYNNESAKIINFVFKENFAGTIDGKITITDVDTGNNALFSVELLDIDNATTIKYTDAFIVVPTAGYRTGEYEISVKNSSYLDFEDTNWDNFQFFVHSFGNLNTTNEDNLLVNITLIDYNDELPIFENTSYECTVKETIEKGKTIIQVKATDRDAEDETLQHTLLGADSVTRCMTIDSTEGIISVAIDDAFDYDRLNPISFQVKATDKADPAHETIVQVTVKLDDVNNKAPTYTTGSLILVDENQDINICLNTSITASDVDTTSNLTAEIDWDNSFVMKNSLKLDNSKVGDVMRFLDLQYETADGQTDGTITISLSVNDLNPKNTAPDYETFDALYLNITITDQNTEVPQFADKMTTAALIVININDVNDNAPIFTKETLNKNRTIHEEAKSGIVGTIVATDADVGSNVTYSCVYVDKKYDWFESDNSGQISVKDKTQIDCDTDQIYYVSINCTATDQVHNTSQIFKIYILDRNNKIPQILVNKTVYIEEESEETTSVTEIEYTDADRDIDYKTSRCMLEQTNAECYSAFEIQNNIVVVKKGAVLDRDEGIRNYNCTVTCIDNPTNVEDEGHQQNFSYFSIVLIDINDNCPILETLKLETSENLAKGELIGAVLAKDIDEDLNADIDMTILKITKDEKEFNENIFDLKKIEADYVVNETFKQWNLYALEDLKDYYGTYILQLNLSDKGTPQQSTDEYQLEIDIRRFNYYKPTFIFPSEDNSSFLLNIDQQSNAPLILNSDSKYLGNFTINNVEDQCSNKWTPTFAIKQTQPETDTFFVLKTLDRCISQLQVDNYDKNQALNQISYTLEISVSLADDIIPEEGEEGYNTTITVEMVFVNINEEPTFDNIEVPWTIFFLENTVDSDNSTASLLRKAHYRNTTADWSIFYFLITDDESLKQIFTVDQSNGTVSLQQPLDYGKQQTYSFQIFASKNQTVGNGKPNAYLSVIINVIDTNSHVPQWNESSFFGAIMKNTNKGSLILTATAIDEDEIDNDQLIYSINSTIDRDGSDSIKRIETPFKLGEKNGAVTLNFVVDYNMYGNFQFKVKVEDAEDPYGNGPHENITTVKIYIVTDDNTVDIMFENTLEEITQSKEKVLECISKALSLECHDQNIKHDSENGVESSNVTVASIYCVASDELCSSDDILLKLSNLNTYQNLRKNLSVIGVFLQALKTDDKTIDNLDQKLRTALIIVSVLLGTLVVFITITLYLKIRGLNNRLRKLTEQKFGSDESNLNRKGLNAPTTNIFAVEGSNPVYNMETGNGHVQFEDQQSIQSELDGIEDNPEFDLDDERNKEVEF